MLAALLSGSASLLLITGPGWWAARRAGLPLPALAGLIAGAVALVTGVFVLQVAGLGFNRLTLAAVWIVWAALCAALARRTAEAAPATAAAPVFSRRERAFIAIAVVPSLAIVAWRATAYPLFGVDTGFRWGLLAELMWRTGSLDFYPATSARDFALYVWPDGIPPLVSSLYLHAYAVAGRVAPVGTAPVVLAQYLLLLAGTGALARRHFSDSAAAWAVVLLALTPLAAWASTMGHETGLTALSLVGVLLYLPRNRTEETSLALGAAGLAAAAGALSREYGWAFVALGLGLAWRRRLSWRGLVLFAAVVALTAAPWYLRNAFVTGNPLFNHSFGGLLPINAAHERLMEIYRESYAFWPQWRGRPLALLENNSLLLVLGLAGVFWFRAQARPFLIAAALIAMLWIASVPYTAAGLTNSLRVLNPALPLVAVLGGAACAAIVDQPRRPFAVIIAIVALASGDAALRALTLPNSTYHLPPAQWLRVDAHLATFQDRPAYHELVQLTTGTRVLALGPNVYLSRLGMDVLPPWAPVFGFLFDPALPAAEARRRLHALGVRFLLVSRGAANHAYLGQCPAFADATPDELRPIFARDELVLFALTAPAAANAP